MSVFLTELLNEFLSIESVSGRVFVALILASMAFACWKIGHLVWFFLTDPFRLAPVCPRCGITIGGEKEINSATGVGEWIYCECVPNPCPAPKNPSAFGTSP